MIPWTRLSCRAAAVLLFAISFVSSAYSQTETATIRGTVADLSGAVVPQAGVRLIDVDRGTTTEVATGNTGFYTFAGVRPGRYRLQVSKAGFKVVTLTGLTVNVLDDIEQNFKLEVGPVSESLVVQADAVNVNSTDGTVSTVV